MIRNRLVFPPIAAIPLVFFFNLSYGILFDVFANAFFSGTIVGYIIYDLTHYFLHHQTPWLEYYKSLKAYHIMHHYKNPKLGFGVSNKLWDYAFDTVLREKEVKKVTADSK